MKVVCELQRILSTCSEDKIEFTGDAENENSKVKLFCSV